MHERSDPTSFLRISPDVRLGKNVAIHCFVNLYGCSVGDDSRVGAFVEIQKNAVIGARCKISSHTFICEGVTIEDEVFVGHGVVFINDRRPRATRNGALQGESDWELVPSVVERGASLGSEDALGQQRRTRIRPGILGVQPTVSSGRLPRQIEVAYGLVVPAE